ncbi:uri1, prefoldin-like chaperone [Halocaridina rubra]|uniref:Uri1, prefoldin-like chaperone n=1 Tax=Halocaridina rubra TaxID=373956 RepID=A0AAN8WYG1_HALRR
MKRSAVGDVKTTGTDESDALGTKYSLQSVQHNLDNLSVLQKEHRQRLRIVEEECSKLKKFRDDYVHLRKRLKTLPDKTSHEAMIPLGPLAFMPGRLIHTNEILVLLGDNWFVERSAKEAVEIVNRRINDCDEKIKGAESTKIIHANWLKETSELFSESQGQVEIIESLTEEEFEKSKMEHRKKVAKHYENKRQIFARDEQESDVSSDCSAPTEASQEAFISKLDEADKKAYESIMKRLDQLELEEDEDTDGSQSTEDNDRDDIEYCEMDSEVGGAQSSELNNEDCSFDGEDDDKTSLSKQRKKLKRRVSWADDKRPLHTVIPDDDSENIYRIKYTTKQLSLPLMEKEGFSPDSGEENDNAEMGGATACIQSPSDLYKVFGTRRSSLQDHPPRGILKKTYSNPENQSSAQDDWCYVPKPVDTTSDSPDDEDDETTLPQPTLSSPKDSESLEPAFTYKILERDINVDNTEEARASFPEDNQIKKVSRFKASRMKK